MKSTYKFLIGGLVVFATLAAISIQGLQEMTVFFHTPKEILIAPADFENKVIRIGALVPTVITPGASTSRVAAPSWGTVISAIPASSAPTTAATCALPGRSPVTRPDSFSQQR